jgi:hypothetical protein
MSRNRDMQDRDRVAKGLGWRGDSRDQEMAQLLSRDILQGGLRVIERGRTSCSAWFRATFPNRFRHRQL